MALKVTVTMPDFPDDYEFGINGLGLFQNGKAREITEEQELGYYNEFGLSVRDGTKDTEYIKVEGTALVKGSDLPEPPSTESATTAPVEDGGN